MCVTKFMHIIYLLVLSLNRFHNIYFFQTSDLLRCLFFLVIFCIVSVRDIKAQESP